MNIGLTDWIETDNDWSVTGRRLLAVYVSYVVRATAGCQDQSCGNLATCPTFALTMESESVFIMLIGPSRYDSHVTGQQHRPNFGV